MTISTSSNTSPIYAGSGSTGPFAFAFKIFTTADVVVTKADATGAETVLTETTHYTVSPNGDQNANPGGTVLLVTGLPVGESLVLQRRAEATQETDLQSGGAFLPEVIENALDKLTMLAQQQQEELSRTYKSPVTSELTVEEWLAAIVAAAGGLVLPLSVGQGGTGGTTAAAARTTLGAASLGANTFTGLQTFSASADIASAATLDLTAATGNIVRITGTTATSAVTLNNGQYVICYAAGAWPLTYHATNNPVPGGADYTCAAGDLVIYSKNNSGEISVQIVPKDGGAVVGKVRGALTLTGTISPSQITADQNDYSPTGLSGASVIRITTDSTLRVLTGLAGGADGRVICIDYLSGSGGLKLADDSASSTAANRFDLAADVTLTAPCIAVLKYDATSSRWRLLASPPSSGTATITLGTPQATTSGTSIDFTSIPAGTKQIIVSGVGVSTSGTSSLLVQLGDAGGVEASGYTCNHNNFNGTVHANVTTGFSLHAAVAAAGTYDFQLVLALVDASTFTWSGQHICNNSSSAHQFNGGGAKSLSAVLDRIRLTTAGGTDTFDAGKLNILYLG